MRTIASSVCLILAACSAPQPKTDEAPMEHESHSTKQHHAHDSMQHSFEDAERWSKVFDAPERDAWQMPAHVIEVMEISPGSTVADIGAGTGYFMSYLAEAVGADGSVLALDIEPALVEHMRKRAGEAGMNNVEVRVCQPDDPEIGGAALQRVLIVNTWHHIADRANYAEKVAAGLAPGGAVYIVEFTLETERGPPKDHRLAPETVIAELAAAGLTASVVEESLPDQYVVVGRR